MITSLSKSSQTFHFEIDLSEDFSVICVSIHRVIIRVFTISTVGPLDEWSPFASVKLPRPSTWLKLPGSGKLLETHIERQRLVTGLGVDPLFQKGQAACWFSGGGINK